MLPTSISADDKASLRSIPSVEPPSSDGVPVVGLEASPRPAFAEESSSLVHGTSNVDDGLRHRARLRYGALALVPLAFVGIGLGLSGASTAQLLGVAAAASLAAIVSWRLADRHARRQAAWLARVSEECCAIDMEWRYREGRLRTDPAMPTEIRRFFRDVDRMARRIDGSMERLRTAVKEGEALRGQLEEVLHSREQEIQTRTVELQAANLDLERLARQDGLTGIANHRRFVEFADQVWRIGIRDQRPVSVIMIDVDHFKDFNDIYGHQAGDQCLKKVSAAIASIARRPLDLAARYGGEEFAIVLGQTEPEDALQLAEQARRAVVAEDIAHSGSLDYGVVTISLGVASLRPHRDTEVKTLISLADKALYRAKRNGRNRTAM
ncbi:MAG: diguanylate cyclase [Acidobacteriota bacterium]